MERKWQSYMNWFNMLETSSLACMYHHNASPYYYITTEIFLPFSSLIYTHLHPFPTPMLPALMTASDLIKAISFSSFLFLSYRNTSALSPHHIALHRI